MTKICCSLSLAMLSLWVGRGVLKHLLGSGGSAAMILQGTSPQLKANQSPQNPEIFKQRLSKAYQSLPKPTKANQSPDKPHRHPTAPCGRLPALVGFIGRQRASYSTKYSSQYITQCTTHRHSCERQISTECLQTPGRTL